MSHFEMNIAGSLFQDEILARVNTDTASNCSQTVRHLMCSCHLRFYTFLIAVHLITSLLLNVVYLPLEISKLTEF